MKNMEEFAQSQPMFRKTNVPAHVVYSQGSVEQQWDASAKDAKGAAKHLMPRQQGVHPQCEQRHIQVTERSFESILWAGISRWSTLLNPLRLTNSPK